MKYSEETFNEARAPGFMAESAANCGEKGESWPCNFLPLPGRSARLAPRFLFSFDYPRAAKPFAPPFWPPRGCETDSSDGGYRTKRGERGGERWRGLRSAGVAVLRNFREITLRRAARLLSLRREREISVIFSRWESIGPPTYAGRAAAAMVVDTLGWVRLSPSA